MSKMVWMDGRLVPLEQAAVSVFDHGLLYGDGVFEGLRQYNGRVFRLFAFAEALGAFIASGPHVAALGPLWLPANNLSFSITMLSIDKQISCVIIPSWNGIKSIGSVASRNFRSFSNRWFRAWAAVSVVRVLRCMCRAC